jgi:AraC-like DNA-binding protein
LRPFVRCLWLVDERDRPVAPGARERVLPSGSFDLVVLLRDSPIRVYSSLEDPVGHVVGHAALTGSPAAHWIRDVSEPSHTVGVHFRPGGAAALLGIAATEIAPRHVALGELWGSRAEHLRDALCSAPTPASCLDTLERALLGCLPRAHEPHPAVHSALHLLSQEPWRPIGPLVEASGLSHARFLRHFRDEVGHTPKAWGRLLRFQRLIVQAASLTERDWATIAREHGYSDQPHLVREFRAFSGTTPTRYAPADPSRPHHVLLA